MNEDQVWQEIESRRVPSQYLCTKEQRRDRLSICEQCEDYTSLRLCKHCMCFMPLKTWITINKCPIDKWSALNEYRGESAHTN